MSYVFNYYRRIGRLIPNTYGSGYGPIWLDDVGCLGTEAFIGDCYHLDWGSNNCAHYEDVAVACYNATENGTFLQLIVITCFLFQ